uniref:POPDC1-3 domain-containing protein n=1 Tax=Eptatretus burgeri TaxID=7764 RepID=A0A8C4QPG5_EPTBU
MVTCICYQLSSSVWKQRHCITWKQEAEIALFHIACVACFLATFGGTNIYSFIYTCTLLCIAFLGWMFWWWFEVCALEGVFWSGVLGFLCIIQVAHAYLRLRQPCLHIIYYLNGCLLTCSARVTSGGRFLHSVESFQFLDSPEWESLNPEELATFQVTITADQPCKVASWPLSHLRALLTQDSFLSNIMGVLTAHDVADKLSAVHNQAWAAASPDNLRSVFFAYLKWDSLWAVLSNGFLLAILPCRPDLWSAWDIVVTCTQ